jgi:fluoroquinolone resistance protein
VGIITPPARFWIGEDHARSHASPLSFFSSARIFDMQFSNTQQKEFTQEEFKKVVIKNDLVRMNEFNACTFLKCSFNATAFQDCTFHDCTFKECDLSLVKLKGCSFTNTRFESSQLIGVNWTETAWAKSKVILTPVNFSNCVINYSTFMGLDLKKVVISKCIAHDVSFEEVDLTRANCTYTDFMNSRFLHADLTDADFTGAQNYAIAASLNTLKRTKFSLPEAMSLLYNLDISLTEYEVAEKK